MKIVFRKEERGVALELWVSRAVEWVSRSVEVRQHGNCVSAYALPVSPVVFLSICLFVSILCCVFLYLIWLKHHKDIDFIQIWFMWTKGKSWLNCSQPQAMFVRQGSMFQAPARNWCQQFSSQLMTSFHCKLTISSKLTGKMPGLHRSFAH